MTEGDAVDAVDEPLTVQSLASDLRELGIAGETVLVHSSMQSLGWVCGEAQAVVEALMAAVTESGTLVMPTYTGQYTNPEAWSNPPIPDDWIPTVREKRPTFRPQVTPTRSMGAVPECFRTFPDAVRSDHPTNSFAAWGDGAEDLVADHELDYGLGDGSPLADIYDREGYVLMLGTDHETNTSLHLAENRADFPKTPVKTRVPVQRDGERVLLDMEGFERSTDDFPEAGAAFEADHEVTTGTVGAAEAKLLPQRPLVDFAVEWFGANR